MKVRGAMSSMQSIIPTILNINEVNHELRFGMSELLSIAYVMSGMATSNQKNESEDWTYTHTHT